MPDENNDSVDQCKVLLERIADALESVQEAQVFIVSDLVQIKQALGGA
jgi:hypothetical protein